MICLVYVDDYLIFVPDDSNFDSMLHKLRTSNLSLEKESDIEGFLGIYLNTNHNDGFVELTQTGLIDRTISAIILEDAITTKTPVEYGDFPKDEHGEIAIVTLITLALYVYFFIYRDILVPNFHSPCRNALDTSLAQNYLMKLRSNVLREILREHERKIDYNTE